MNNQIENIFLKTCVCVFIYNSSDSKRRSYKGTRFGELGKELVEADY